jgi:hypothetical protein
MPGLSDVVAQVAMAVVLAAGGGAVGWIVTRAIKPVRRPEDPR